MMSHHDVGSRSPSRERASSSRDPGRADCVDERKILLLDEDLPAGERGIVYPHDINAKEVRKLLVCSDP